MQIQNPFLSIIIPVYNAAQSIERCLESVVSQSFQNYEVIIINDGSTDSSSVICNRYADRDNRFKLFDKSNGGVSSARNFGLDLIKGTHVLFLDADDAFAGDIFQNLINGHIDGYDLILFSSITYPKQDKRSFDKAHLLTDVAIGDFLNRYYTEGFTQPWAKVYKNDIIEKYLLRFDETLNLGEDTLFVGQYLANISALNVVPSIGYIYTDVDQGHLSRKSMSFELLEISLSKILPSIHVLENKFKVDLEVHRNSLIHFFLHRYLKSISNEDLFVIRKKLKIMGSNQLLFQAFRMENNRSGMIQKVFNMLARNKFFFMLSVYYKYFAYRYF